MERKVVVIAGPTCSGKTELSLNLAQKLKSEIISADSRQFYKYLDIGTAKVSVEDRRKIKHHFIDFLAPDECYNVSSFERDAVKVIKSLHSKKKIPIIAGGSGLYIKAIIDGIFNTADTDSKYREKLLELKKEFGNEYLHKKLRQIDPESASTMLPQNWKRIIRALEVFELTGKTIGQLQNEYKRTEDFQFYQFGLNWERDLLYKRIEHRVDLMIEEGLVDEVKNLLKMRYNKSLNSLNTVGYKEIISYLEGEISLEKAIELIKRNTRRFAKRQMTWFRKDSRINWLDVNKHSHPEELVSKITGKIG